MSELFDSLNFNASAGPSSSQSSSQPSASKVYWHASPSPVILQQLRNRVPSRDQGSPTLPLCTQAFIGELRKLPASSSLQSPLVSRSGAKRKLTAGFSAVHHHGTVLSDDDDDAGFHSDTEQAKRVAASKLSRRSNTHAVDMAQTSPETRRLLDAGSTGRLRQVSPDSMSTTSATSLDTLPVQDGFRRRPVRRRKKDSLVDGLGDIRNTGASCLKLFEDLQAAIQDMHSHSTDSLRAQNAEHRRSKDVSVSSYHDGKLTQRGLINRTTSAPTPGENTALIRSPMSAGNLTARTRDLNVGPKRTLTPTKSDHDVFRATSTAQLQEREALRPTTNMSACDTVRTDLVPELAQRKRSVSHTVVDNLPLDDPALVVDDDAVEITHVQQAPSVAVPKGLDSLKAAGTDASSSPVKRSARIEAMQGGGTTGKKLGVRASPSGAKSRTHSPAKLTAVATVQTSRTPQRSRSTVLPGMSQARQPGLPRTGSQFTSSQAQPAITAIRSTSIGGGLRAPFRPPARASTINPSSAKAPSPDPFHPHNNDNAVPTSSTYRKRQQQPSSSDDSFPDEDDDFLALACQLEY